MYLTKSQTAIFYSDSHINDVHRIFSLLPIASLPIASLPVPYCLLLACLLLACLFPIAYSPAVP
ncbi:MULTISPECIES: hypothetical protein [Moorena]|uniref:hypothetical protein n=1 Tax=Moorena TaxID=1155738 RepID=UPI0010553F6F|nr:MULTISPECIES: hypothetical protein [Moorena]NEP34585.1 hypothetical protein [Moorena sp. SIO3B2]NEP68697.1 hypothetical protein [Moorena sp. SIO3A5]NEQ08215.1 hypothetical protein [Moorena sp. SIO4E2]NER86675.1 hypothetical protein [Moorena sp. SIO3A2]NES43967.1 hypothetical protein [Moorena sp. SIO2C4]